MPNAARHAPRRKPPADETMAPEPTARHADTVDVVLRALDALPQNIAILDGAGTILAVNEAWRRFGDANGAADEIGPGADYLAACDQGAADGEATAAAAADGLRDLLAGGRPDFAVRYPCHAPSEERWFEVTGTAFEVDGRRHVVLAHREVTERKRAEDALAASEERLEAANRELRRALAEQEVLARTDHLTGAHARRHFYDVAAHELAVARRYGHPLAVVLLDVDRFKRVNDRLGHHAGDEVLRRMAEVARRTLRQADLFARHGGEEFIALLPHSDLAAATAAADHLRRAIAAERIATAHGPLAVTISAGTAEALPGDTVDDLVRRADEALYRAKAAGRNRVVTAGG